MSQTIAKTFQTQGYVKLPGVLSIEICELFCKYVRLKALIKPKIRRGSDALSGVHREYADPLLETLLEDLRPQIETATGLALYPTLSFCYHYTHGNILRPHKDRASCEIVAGLCLGADADFKREQRQWPLHLKDKPIIELNYGDALIFKGNAIEHWRDRFNGKWFVSAILGYVDQNGPHAHHKFDQRKSLGLPHIGMIRWLLGDWLARAKQW